MCGFTAPGVLFTLRQISPSGNVLICHQTKFSPAFTRLAIKSPVRDAAFYCDSMNAGQYTRDKIQGHQHVFLSLCQMLELSLLPHNCSCSFRLYFAYMVTPDTAEQNLMAAPLSACTNTQLLVCKRNAEQKDD